MTLVSLLLFAAVVPVPKDRPESAPKGPPPSFYVVNKVDIERLEFESTQPVITQEVVAFPRPVAGAGRGVMEVVSIKQTVTRVRRVRVSLRGATASTAAGEELSTLQALKRLTPGMVVLCGTNGQAVESAYLRAIRPETIILVLPRPPAAGVPVPQLDPIQP